MKFIQLTTTFSDREAAVSMGKGMVKSRLVACAQLEGPIESVYRWQGEVEQATEWRLCLKTRQDFFDQIVSIIEEEHTYEVPEVVATELIAISTSYSEWLTSQLQVDGPQDSTGNA